MRRMILRVIALMLCFSFGLGAERLIRSTTKSVPPPSPAMLSHTELVARLPPPPPRILVPAPIPSPDLIFDYDSKKFVPDGAYFIVGPKPKAFAGFSSFGLGMDEIGSGRMEAYFILLTKSGNDDNYQEARYVLVTERRLLFATSPSTGSDIEYRFEGEFLTKNFDRAAFTNKPVLRGTLTKTNHGKKVAEQVFNFRIEFDRC